MIREGFGSIGTDIFFGATCFTVAISTMFVYFEYIIIP